MDTGSGEAAARHCGSRLAAAAYLSACHAASSTAEVSTDRCMAQTSATGTATATATAFPNPIHQSVHSAPCVPDLSDSHWQCHRSSAAHAALWRSATLSAPSSSAVVGMHILSKPFCMVCTDRRRRIEPSSSYSSRMPVATSLTPRVGHFLHFAALVPEPLYPSLTVNTSPRPNATVSMRPGPSASASKVFEIGRGSIELMSSV